MLHDKNREEIESVITKVFIDPIRRKPSSRIKKNHPSNLIVGYPSESMVFRQRYVNLVNYVFYTSMIEPKNIKEADVVRESRKLIHTKEWKQPSYNLLIRSQIP